jgi:hypothetical protein
LENIFASELSADNTDLRLDAGAPDTRSLSLPDGPDRELIWKAVEIILEWEECGDGTASDLACRLYFDVFCKTKESSNRLK